MTYSVVSIAVKKRRWELRQTYRDTVVVLLADALSFCLALLEGVLVFEFGSHFGRFECVMGKFPSGCVMLRGVALGCEVAGFLCRSEGLQR